MAIWLYPEQSSIERGIEEIERYSCRFCKCELSALHQEGPVNYYGTSSSGSSWTYQIHACQSCGWWNIISNFSGIDYNQDLVSMTGYIEATLANLDSNDITTPLSDVRAYLLADYEKRKYLHPRLVELTVASVFHDHGYSVISRSYSKDGGIDIILLDGPADQRIGVQVKRYANAVGVERIREFTGALMIEGITKGIFVTTSKFTSAATKLTNRIRESATMPAIELYDASSLYEALRLSQRPMYDSLDASDVPWTPLVGSNKIPIISKSNSGFACE